MRNNNDAGRSGRGQGRGRGRNKGRGLGPGGECICQNCNITVTHRMGVPCYDMKCPLCGQTMMRK